MAEEIFDNFTFKIFHLNKINTPPRSPLINLYLDAQKSTEKSIFQTMIRD